MKPSSTRGKTKATTIRSQLMVFVLRGVTTGTSVGLTCARGAGVAADTAEVAVAVTAGFAVLLDWDAAMAEPPVKVKASCASTPSSTSVVANCSGFSESAGVTRYQCPSHIAVRPPPSASAQANKLPTVITPARPERGSGRT